MAWRIDKSVIRGEIDNRTKGCVTGRIWFVGRTEPVILCLDGNCYRDIAGGRLTFENASPEPGDLDGLGSLQEGSVGDITASRKVKVLQCPVEDLHELTRTGKELPFKWGNSLYLEWYSQANGRVVIESADFKLTPDLEPAWRMTAVEERDQREQNRLAIRGFMQRLDDARDGTGKEDEFEDEEPMDEFAWEKFLRESDEQGDKHATLWAQYRDHPDCERIIAREMGWTWLDDALDADARGAFEEDLQDMSDEDVSDLVPDPLTEGRDWIRTEDGDVRHPLGHRALQHAVSTFHTFNEQGLLGDGGSEDVHDMVFQAEMVSAKLAGALNGLAYREDPDGAFIVALLKRALKYVQNALGAADKVAKLKLVEESELSHFRAEIFAIREEMLNLMKQYRTGPGP